MLGMVGAPRCSLYFRMLKMQGADKTASLKSIRKRSGAGECARRDGMFRREREFLTGKPRNNSNRGRSRTPAGSYNKSL